MEIDLKSTITCPECGYKKEEEIPTGDCQLFYVCDNCLAVLKPKIGDCCVFYSYGTEPCYTVHKYNKCG